MISTGQANLANIFKALGCGSLLSQKAGLEVTSPPDGNQLALIAPDTRESLDKKISKAVNAQKKWGMLTRALRVSLLEGIAELLRHHRDELTTLIMLEAGKTNMEGLTEVNSSSDVMLKTFKEAALPELGGMLRVKERPPVGVIGLITSFNFPLVVANWTLAPALLAGNAVIWKPSEKTPLTALAYKAIFDKVALEHTDLLQVAVGGGDIGGALVASEQVDMVSATGSVAMGKNIKAALAKKSSHAISPILELGGNNGVIISDKLSPSHLEWAVKAVCNSFFGTSGQRCTNTRRLIVHKKVYPQTIALFTKQIHALIMSGAIHNPMYGASNEYGYGPLIDAQAFERFESAKRHVTEEGGTLHYGNRVSLDGYPNAYYVEPALAELPRQTAVMMEETFAPLLFVTSYEVDIDQALAMLNAPANAGLVNGIYTQSQMEAYQFGIKNQAGHGVINSPKGTGTPAFGMGFGGNKESGEGEILNTVDPLRAFTRSDRYSRIAQNKDIVMNYLDD